MKNRCDWTKDNALMNHYHDTEWGVPLFDDYKLFEFMVLDTFQAGLSWSIVLNKREKFRIAFDNFDFYKIAMYDENKIKTLQNDANIIRNKLKIKATNINAICFINIIKEYGSFSQYIWQFVGLKPIHNHWQNIKEIPAQSSISDKMSIDLKKRGFKFVGTTICYAFMQASGLVNDHLISCFRYHEIIKLTNQYDNHKI